MKAIDSVSAVIPSVGEEPASNDHLLHGTAPPRRSASIPHEAGIGRTTGPSHALGMTTISAIRACMHWHAPFEFDSAQVVVEIAWY